MNIMTPDDFDIINYPYVLPRKKPKHICVPKQQNVIGTLIKNGAAGGIWPGDRYTAVGKGGCSWRWGPTSLGYIIACDFFKMCYCFEPLAEHVLRLIQNTLELNQVTNVQVFPFGFGSMREVAFLSGERQYRMGSLKPNFPTMERLEQEVDVTLDSQMPPEVEYVTFIHVDTEGHDVKVLQVPAGSSSGRLKGR